MLIRLGGLRAAHAMLYPVSLHYALFDRRAAQSILPYIRRRFPKAGRFKRWLAMWRIFLEQGRMLVDRHAVLTQSARVEITLEEGAADKLKLLAEEGGVLLMSHTGNWQAAIPALANMGKPVHLVMAVETNNAVAETLRLGGEGGAVRVLDAGNFMESAPKIVAALAAGEIVSLMGDRAYGGTSAPVQFLSGLARFPVAAFRIAAVTGKKVFVLFVPRTGRGRYVVQVPEVVQPQSRRDARDGLARYAAALGAFANAHPFQCFPFVDVWQNNKD